MVQVPNEGSAAARTRWLAELAEALDEATRVMKQLRLAGCGIDPVEHVELSARIEAAKVEVESVRRTRSLALARHSCPEWTKNVPWSLSA